MVMAEFEPKLALVVTFRVRKRLLGRAMWFTIASDMNKESQSHPLKVRWWENEVSYSATKSQSEWKFYEKESQTVRWFEIPGTPELVARAEAALAQGEHVRELPEYEADSRTAEVQFYSCFISYAGGDQSFAERIYRDLQKRGVRCWFAGHDMRGGKLIHEQIDEAIRLYDRLLLILSPLSVNSAWVKAEILAARKRELKEGRRNLFPIRLVDFETLQRWEYFNADLGTDLAQAIRSYYIPDFTNWTNEESYQIAFERLVRDLSGS
jgi:TIR domain